MKRNLSILLICGALLTFLMSPAYATCSAEYNFAYISGDVTNAPSLTHMLVTDDFNGYLVPIGATVMFEFTTDVSPGAIVQIGFYDGTSPLMASDFLGTASVGTVNMPQDIPPVPIPGANPPGGYYDAQADVFLSFSAANPQVDNGVGTGEAFAVFFGNADCGDVIAALNLAIANPGPYDNSNPFPNGGLSVALKIAGLSGSTEAVNVPLPPSVLLMGSGLLGLVGWRRFRKS
jgi:hypothetical protein